MDIPSFSYQFSFEQSSAWPRTYAPGRELAAYAAHCVDKYGLRPRIRFGTAVLGADYLEAQGLWELTLQSGETRDVVTARFLVNAGGVLTVPKLPDIAGVDSFAGPTVHTARWDHALDLRGKRVGIIGTGASAVQVIPEIAPIVERLTVFQRTPIWCFPKFDVPLTGAARSLMRLPLGRTVQRLVSQLYVELTGLRGRQRPGLPELLHRLRPVRVRRFVVLRAHRGADPPHRALPAHRPAAQPPSSRSDRRPTTASSPR